MKLVDRIKVIPADCITLYPLVLLASPVRP